MKYTFSKHTYIDSQTGESKIAPLLILENQDQYGSFFIDEITNLKSEYLKKIISSIELVISEAKPDFSFGFEAYSFYCTTKSVAVIDQFDNDKLLTEIPITDFIVFLKEWYSFINQPT